MSITIEAYSLANTSSRSISVDFACEVLSSSFQSGYNVDQQYFFKFTTTAVDQNGQTYPPRIVTGLDATSGALALAGQKQSASNTAAAYTDIRALVYDYAYDYFNGHTAGQFATNVAAKAPMKFNG